MKEIKAFVGHSFLESDAEVIGKFTKYFDGLALSHPTFSWESAEKAEPRVLTEKVLRIIADKNTFVGICTRKERAVSADALHIPFLQPSSLKARESEFAWKTSDWIIQEIGMAVGKGLDVILLVENGVRDPGGLQGDIEYIPFSREAPEKSFVKILEMLSALSPKSTSQLAIASDIKPTSEDANIVAADNDRDLRTPDETWNRKRYERAMFMAVSMEDEAQIKTLSEAYMASEDASHDDNSTTWEALIEYMRISFGKSGKLDRLKKLADTHPESSKTRTYLAGVYVLYEQHKLAAETYIAALNAATTSKAKADCARLAVKQFALSQLPDKVSETLAALRRLIEESPSAEKKILDAMYDLAEIDKDQDVVLAIMERVLELEPDDHDTRFNLAYKQSVAGNEELALYHYLKIPRAERTAVAWNNLGAAFDQLTLPAKAVEAYTRSMEMGETLAMSNLGNKLMNVGFVREAQEECDKALATKQPHRNIGQLLTTLQALPEEEEKKETELLDASKPKISYLQQLGRAAALELPTDFGESWQGPDCVFNVIKADDRIRIVGTFERPNPFSGLGGILGGLASQTAPGPKQKYTIEYEGKIRGRAIFGTIKRERDGASLLESAGGSSKIFMVFSDDGSQISVMEKADTNNPSYHVLKRVQLLIKHLPD